MPQARPERQRRDGRHHAPGYMHDYTCACVHMCTHTHVHVPRCMMSTFAPLALRPCLSHSFFAYIELALDKVDCLIIRLMNTVKLKSVELRTDSWDQIHFTPLHDLFHFYPFSQLGTLLGHLETLLDQLETLLDQLKTLLDQLRTLLDQLETLLDQLGTLKDQLGTILDQLGTLLDQLETLLD